MNRILLLFLCCIGSYGAACKGHRYKAELPRPDSAGFYKIVLPPALTSLMKDDASDLRMYDSSGKEVPYLLKVNQPGQATNRFREYEITGRSFLHDSITQITLKNKDNRKIDNISLVIRNAEVSKQMRLTGSFDGKQWYVVRESETLSSIRNQKDVSEIRLLNFPLTDYSFYRLEINDSRSAPLDIIRAGYYETIPAEGACIGLPVTWRIADSLHTKSSWLHITLNSRQAVDRLSLQVQEPSLFLRSADLYVEENGRRRFVQNLVLQSGHPLVFPVGWRTRAFWLELKNSDNRPLVFSSVTCCQWERYALAQMAANQGCYLAFGDSLLQAPVYDLAYFESAIPAVLPVLQAGKAVVMTQAIEPAAAQRWFSDKRFIWAALAVVLLLLLVATMKMIRELNKTDSASP